MRQDYRARTRRPLQKIAAPGRLRTRPVAVFRAGSPSMCRDLCFFSICRKSLAATLVCSALVAHCSLFVDRPVAFFVYNHRLAAHTVLKWLTYPPPILQDRTPLALTALMVRRAFGPFRRWQRVVLAGCVSMIVADQFR